MTIFQPRLLPLILLLAVAFPATAQTTSGKPLTQMSEGARRLIAVTVTGLKHFKQEDVIAASGLPIGSTVNEDDFKKAGRRLGETGAFSDITYSYSYSSAGTKLELKVVETEKFLPARFEDFVWFSNEELRKSLKEHIPLFDGQLPLSGSMPDEVSDVLQAMLVQIGVPGHVNYVKFSHDSGPIESYNYSVADISIRVRNINFSGAPADELARLQDAAEHMPEREYSHARITAFVERRLLPIFRSDGYLKAAFSSPQPKVVQAQAGENDDATKNATIVDVDLAIDPGIQYKLAGVEWSGNQEFSSETLKPMIHAKPGKPADTVRLADDLLTVRDLYATRGYVAATIKAEAHFDDAAGAVTLALEVKEGAVYHMGELEFRGLDNSLTAKLRNAWKIRPGEVYDGSYLKEYLPAAEKLLPTNFDWKVDPHVTANVREKTVDVDLQYSVSVPK